RYAARMVGVTNDGHAVDIHFLTGHRAFDVTAALGGQVHNHRAFLHVVQHVFGDQTRRHFARNGSGGDDQIGLRHFGSHLLTLLAVELFGLLRGVTTGRTAFFLRQIEFHELSAQRFHLLTHFRTGIVGFNHRTQTTGGRDGHQTGHTSTNDEYARRVNGTGSGHQHREVLWQCHRTGQYGTVTGDRTHGAEDVHR